MYLNTFISLDENISGYGIGYKKPSGHITMSNPGVIKCYVQNLKALEGKEYIAYAIGKGKKAVRLGAIKDPEKTKQTVWNIDINNVNGQNVGAKDIDCIAIVIEGDTVGSTDTILIGYSKEKYLITPLMEAALPKKTQTEPQSAQLDPKQTTTKELDGLVNQKEKDAKKEVAAKPELEKVQEEVAAKPELEKVQEEVAAKPELEKAQETPVKPEAKQLKQVTEIGIEEELAVKEVVQEQSPIDGMKLRKILKEVIKEDSEPVRPHQDIQQTLATFMEVQKQVEKEPWQKEVVKEVPREEKTRRWTIDPWSRVREIFESSTPIEPFVDQDEDIDWVMMSNSELASIPQFTYEWVTQPFVSYCYQKFNHLILGRQKGLEQYYVGIPDIYYPNRRYILEYDKIEAFRCAEDKVPCTGDFGYWIARV